MTPTPIPFAQMGIIRRCLFIVGIFCYVLGGIACLTIILIPLGLCWILSGMAFTAFAKVSLAHPTDPMTKPGG